MQEEIQPIILQMLVADVPRNLARFDEASGRFLTDGGWAVTNQDIVYPLALLYTTESPENPYYQDGQILEIIGRAGDAWRDFQNPDGTVEFIKVDGSTWGPTYMPWSMYHWVETYGLLRDKLDDARRQRWEEGLTLAYDGICRNLADGRVHNIPTWNGMAAYRAGKLLQRTDWQDAGQHMIHLAVAEQRPQGYWDEHGGPTTSYNLVYLHAIGLYYFFSGDDSVVDCLRRGTDFHIRYTYPDGRMVETIDGRVKYHDKVVDSAYSGFSLFPQGRRFVGFLLEQLHAFRANWEPHITYIITNGERRPSAGDFGLSTRLASALAHYQVGPEEPIPQDSDHYQIHDEGHSLLRRQDGWFTCVSGFMVPAVESRWGLDRQAFASVWHDCTGLIIGGGNAKSQSAFSNFVFRGGAEPVYLPDSAELTSEGARDSVTLTYGDKQGTLSVEPQSETRLLVQLAASGPDSAANNVVGQLMFKLVPGGTLQTGAGDTHTVDETPLNLSAEQTGGSVTQGRWRIHLPAGSTFAWPVAPFNPYAADGAAPLDEAVAIVTLDPQGERGKLVIEILPAS